MNESVTKSLGSDTSPCRSRFVAIAALSFFGVRLIAELVCGYLYQHSVASTGSFIGGVIIALIPAAVSTSIVAFVRLPSLLSYILLAAVSVFHAVSIRQSLRYAAHGKISEDWGPLFVLGYEAAVMFGIVIIAGVTRGILHIYHCNTRNA